MTIIFFISMFVLGGMLTSKVFEIKVRKIDFLSDAFTKGDEKIHKSIEIVTSNYKRWKVIVNIFIFDFIPRFMIY